MTTDRIPDAAIEAAKTVMLPILRNCLANFLVGACSDVERPKAVAELEADPEIAEVMESFAELAVEFAMKPALAAALPLLPREGVVEVKPLEWEGSHAECILGVYRIGRIGAAWTVYFERGHLDVVVERGLSIDFGVALTEAKAAAQQDYERRIRSSLRSGGDNG